jgi:hypothetical protein
MGILLRSIVPKLVESHRLSKRLVCFDAFGMVEPLVFSSPPTFVGCLLQKVGDDRAQHDAQETDEGGGHPPNNLLHQDRGCSVAS